ATAQAGSNRWTLQGPEGGIVSQLQVSPQHKELWGIAQGIVFHNHPATGLWEFVPLDTPADFVNSIVFDPTDDRRMYLTTSAGRAPGGWRRELRRGRQVPGAWHSGGPDRHGPQSSKHTSGGGCIERGWGRISLDGQREDLVACWTARHPGEQAVLCSRPDG